MKAASRIGLCTDSTAQLPSELIERYDVEVVPITVIVDDHEYLEGIDLTPDDFYAMFSGGHRPMVATSQPSPGQFALAYEELASRGCTEILSVHISAAVSGTLNAARLGARGFEVPVKLVDSGTANFGTGCCVWAAAEAIAAGATIDQAAATAERLPPSIGNVFIVGALDLASGLPHHVDGVPVLGLVDGQIQVVQRVHSIVDAVIAISAATVSWGSNLRVAVGVADARADVVADAVESAVRETASVDEVVRYRIGPSAGAHTGPGTVGCFMYPSAPEQSTPTAK